MNPRFYVRQPEHKSNHSWLVIDRLRIKDHSDVVAILATRREARARARELNNETHEEHRADQQLTVDGELI